jgi:thiol-disulfide isomerase/thioredoxin
MFSTLERSLKHLVKGSVNVKDFLTVCVWIVIAFLVVKIAGELIALLKQKFIHHRIESFEGQKELLLLHMEGCPHCVKIMPDWKEAAAENGTAINMRALETKDDGAQTLIDKHGVTGFPTILLLGNGEKLDTYEGERTKDGFLEYCKQNE